jgi:gliding motility-associated-like protein
MVMKYTLFFGLLFVIPMKIQAQGPNTKPEMPLMYNVTVDPETGNDVITWHASPSDFTDYYNVAETYIPNPADPHVVVTPLPDKIYVPDTTYININSDSHIRSIGYTVIAINDLGLGSTIPSLYDAPDSTIFLTCVFDSCQATITLNWNDYNKWRGSISAYNIKQRLGPYIYQNLATLSEGTNTFVLTGVQVNQTYQLFVEAVNADGRKSTSNRVDIFSRMSKIPGYINTDYATLGAEGGIDLSFTIDNASGLTRYELYRGESPTGPFDSLTTINTTSPDVKYTDPVSFTSGIYYYRLDVLNNCGTAANQSNLGNNIILNGQQTGMAVSLSWNEYIDWRGGVENYKVVRTIGQNSTVVDTLNVGLSTHFNDDISQLVNYENPSSSLICYQVLATEIRNGFNIQGRSWSNSMCFVVNPDVRMPNAFIPNDNELVNQVFEPVFSFLPQRYKLIIYNRLGTKIWEGSQGWDGKVNGSYVPEGVYVYYLKISNYSKGDIEMNGKVAVLYR